MKKLILVSIASALLGLTASVHAITAVAGDLILGFRATAGQGADVNLEVNLGPASHFSGLAAAGTEVLTGLAVADLVTTYGADWATRSDLFWGIAGTTGAASLGTPPNQIPARTIWASRAEITPGTSSQPWPQNGALSLQSSSNAVATLYTGGEGSIDRYSATANSATAAKTASGSSGSWTYQELLVDGVSFRYFNPSVSNIINTFPAAGSSYDGTGYTVLDLFEVRPGAAGSASRLLGGLGLNNQGKLVFSTDVTKFGQGSPPVNLGQPTIVKNGNSITVTLTEVPAGSYILERSTTMEAGGWTDLLTQAPSGGALTFIDNSPPVPRGFYRIKKAP